ncbi:MAG: hypothetical protein SGPRY_013896 [Prymnesium sp.]
MLSNSGVPGRAIVKALNGVRTERLSDFLSTLLTLHNGARVPLRYVVPYSHHQRFGWWRQERLAVITIERTWFGCAVTYPLAGPPEVQAITSSLVRVLFDIPYQIDGVAGLK